MARAAATIECKSQAELDAALKVPNARIVLRGDGSFYFQISGQAHVVARGSSHVEAWGSSHVVARESSHVVARGSSHVEAWESSHVDAWGHIFVRALSALCKIRASASVAVMLHKDAPVNGGQQIKAVQPRTPAEWCAFHGVKVTDGVAILFKGVNDQFMSPKGGNYTPGTVPVAADWDGGKKECGGGLHFSPHPLMTREFIPSPMHYIACPVALADIAVHPDGDYPHKIKARGCVAPVWECDIDGNRIEPETAAA